MSIRIRTRRAGGQVSEELYETAARGLEALEANLKLHRKLGHRISQRENVYTVTGKDGQFVQESTIVPSV